MPTCNLARQMQGRSLSQLMTNSNPISDRTRPSSMGSSPPRPANNNPIPDRKRPLSLPKPSKTVCKMPSSNHSQPATSQIARVPGAHRLRQDQQQQKGSEVSSSSSTCTAVIQSSCDPLPTSKDILVQEVLEAKRAMSSYGQRKKVLRQFDCQQKEEKLKQLQHRRP